MGIPLKLQAARLSLVRQRPYLAAALWRMIPVSKPGLGTMAVDMYWRLYFDPQALEQWSSEEITGVLYHEILHLLRAHPIRMKHFDPRLANMAADMEVNDDIVSESLPLPQNAIIPQAFGFPDGLLAEEYIELLNQFNSQKQPGNQGQTQAADQNEDSGQGQTGGHKQQGDKSGNKSGEQPEEQADHRPGGKGQHDAQEQSRDRGQLGDQSGDQAQSGTEDKPAPACGRCGSCATGRLESWEEPAEGGTDAIGPTEAEILRRVVANEIRRSRPGTVPAHLERWAEATLSSKINWREVLRAEIRRGLWLTSGRGYRTYRNPHPRNDVIIYRGHAAQQPGVAVIVDTSGSITDQQLAVFFSELHGILRALSVPAVDVIVCDTKVHAIYRRVTHADPKKLTLKGGGGTDMRVAIETAERLKPRPDVVVLVTDGDTPWPDKPAQTKVIVVLVGDGDVPEWCKVIKVEEW